VTDKQQRFNLNQPGKMNRLHQHASKPAEDTAAVVDNKAAVRVAAKFLEDVGWDNIITRQASSGIIRASHGERGDVRVNVRHVTLSFTSVLDFPGSEIEVIGVRAYRWMKPKPRYHLFLNADMTHLAILSRETFPEWSVNHHSHTYRCDVKYLLFCSLSEEQRDAADSSQ
jgi:hypothetical protein